MDIFDRLAKSKFRSRFKLGVNELKYISEKGLDTIHSHACDFIRERVAPAEPINDGKQPNAWAPCFYRTTRNSGLLSWLHRKMAQIPTTQRINKTRTRISCFGNNGMDRRTN